MKKEDYTPFTIIMRGYSYEEAEAIVEAMEGLEDYFVVEMTLNTKGAFEHIRKLSEKFGKRVRIGAGTVRSLEEAKQAVEAGAEFLLGPHMFTKQMLDYCQEAGIVSVPSAMTPSEVNQMLQGGADIVKIFPAAVVGPRFFKDIQGPLGKISLMAVGGVGPKNVFDFLANGASYAGMGSSLFRAEDIKNKDVKKLHETLQGIVSQLN